MGRSGKRKRDKESSYPPIAYRLIPKREDKGMSSLGCALKMILRSYPS